MTIMGQQCPDHPGHYRQRQYLRCKEIHEKRNITRVAVGKSKHSIAPHHERFYSPWGVPLVVTTALKS